MNKQKASRANGIFWGIQLLSGIFLLIVLGVHFWALHYGTNNATLSYELISKRLASPAWKVLDTVFLALVLYHALNGVRSIILDFNISKAMRGLLFWFCVMIAVACFIFGLNTINSVM